MKTFIFALLVLFSTQSFAFECNHFASKNGSKLHFISPSKLVITDQFGAKTNYYIPSAGTENPTIKIIDLANDTLHDFNGYDNNLIVDEVTYKPSCK